MAVEEGLRRIHTAGRWILVVGLCFDAVAAALTAAAVFRIFAGSPLILGFGIFGVYLSAIGGIVLLASWILEGFFLSGKPPGA
jgi:hypothetical protein